MTSRSYDVIVAGLGAMGSAAAYALARRGLRVLGIDRFSPPHSRGSSHGQSRIIREAYFEHPLYVPLVQRAYGRWAALERESGDTLFIPTGGLMVGPPEGALVAGARASAEGHGLAHEMLTSAEVQRRFPVVRISGEMVGLFEPRAGVLRPEACIEAHLRLARRAGAELHVDRPVERWRSGGGGVRVWTSGGVHGAGHLVLAAGPWLPTLVPELSPVLEIERQLMHWFTPTNEPGDFAPERCPVTLWEYASGRFAYAFPDLGQGVKVGLHHGGEITRADTVRRDISPAEDEAVRSVLRRFLPSAAGVLREKTVCLYTNMPDGHFLIDRHPAHDGVIVASVCSGHGFKFASVVGDLIAALVCREAAELDVRAFGWRGRVPDG